MILEDINYTNIFNQLYELAPISLKRIIDSTEYALQDPIWHPEGHTRIHIELVTNRLHNAYGDINLVLAGLFHDLGKVDATKWNGETWTAGGHEIISTDIVWCFKNWIIEMGGDVEIVSFIVKNHMRIKYLSDFKMSKKIEFIEHEYFDYVLKFNSADFGGLSLDVKPLLDMTEIKNKISEYKKYQQENDIISNKFNGDIIMKFYPLSGADLGVSIVTFKNHIKDTFNIDFREFILLNDHDTIMCEFDKTVPFIISNPIFNSKFNHEKNNI